MTRRIRFTPFDRLRPCVLGVFLAAAGPATAAEVPFGPAAVVGTPSLPMWTDPGDLDRDGDRDFASAGRFGVVWHENVGGDGSSWTTHTVATTTGIFTSVVQGDLDRDGDVDLLATIVNLDQTVWYENTAGNGSAWTRHTVATGTDGPRFAVLADVDGDGDPDVVSTAVLGGNVLHWHENVAGNGTVWVRHTIATAVYSASVVATADVDRDGDLDVMASSANDQTVAWYENADGAGGSWITRTISSPAIARGDLVPADVDRDGDVDAVVGPGFTDPLMWYENVDGHGGAWTARTIAAPPGQARSISVSDLDGDGDADVMVPIGTAVAMGQAVWYENVDGAGGVWTQRTIGTIGLGAYQVVAADVDGDGDQDAASVSFYGNEVVWYRNQSIHRAVCFAPPTAISTGVIIPGTFEIAAADLDGDGDLDALSAPNENTRFSWHRNLAGDGTAWATQVVTTAAGTFSVSSIATSDLDGDGDVDFVSGVNQSATTFRNATGDGSVWIPETLPSTPPTTVSRVGVADLDADGDVDLQLCRGGLLWLENPGPGTGWVDRTIVSGAGCRFAEAADIDGDGDLDLVVDGFSVLFWYENLGGASAWSLHPIGASYGRSAVLTDVDGDGDPDVLTGASATTLKWFENAAGDGSAWTARTVGTSSALISWQDAADLDGDGDTDGLAGQIGDDGPRWYENLGGGGLSWLAHPILSTSPGGTAPARFSDVDGDGDLDVLLGRQDGSSMEWTRNDGGQVRFNLVDQVPPSANNNDVFSMLRITVTHGGHTGDSDLELARLAVRFQEDAASDPLTSAEANALVEELRVYRDANGNGTFDPGADTLVATVATLALTNGVQVVPFTDGDPNVRVAHGTPAAFFVVAQLTANASEQAPNLFRVTHLATGAQRTLAEDRAADLPLTTACPADFESRIIGPVVPVELMGFTIE